MRPIGFSTGAIALGDFALAMQRVRNLKLPAIELSALRFHELAHLMSALDNLPLAGYRHISLHAPTAMDREVEAGVVDTLMEAATRGFSIVIHPDAVHSWAAWRRLGRSVLVENMDKRKRRGRTVQELKGCFALLPQAGWCFDIAHARQVDPSLTECFRLLRAFKSRLRLVHLSEVNSSSRHEKISWSAACSFRRLAGQIPKNIPVILESVVTPQEIAAEVDMARRALGEIELSEELCAAAANDTGQA